MIFCQTPQLLRANSKVFSGLRNRDQELLLDRDYLLPPSHLRCEFFIFHCLILLQNSTPQGSSYIPVQRPESQLLLQEYRSSDLQKISGENHLHLSINQISPGTQILMDWAQGCSSTLFFLSLGIRSQTVVWILKKGHALPQNSPIMRHNSAHGAVAQTWCHGVHQLPPHSWPTGASSVPSVIARFLRALLDPEPVRDQRDELAIGGLKIAFFRNPASRILIFVA